MKWSGICDESHALEQHRRARSRSSICFAEMTLCGCQESAPALTLLPAGPAPAAHAESPPCTGHRDMGVAPLSSVVLACMFFWCFMCREVHDQLPPPTEDTLQSTILSSPGFEHFPMLFASYTFSLS